MIYSPHHNPIHQVLKRKQSVLALAALTGQPVVPSRSGRLRRPV